MFKLCLAAAVYHIWREQNGRDFQRVCIDSVGLARKIMELEEVKACICSWRRMPNPAENQRLCLDWGIPFLVLERL